jgi:plasmid stabilization system protein ParE
MTVLFSPEAETDFRTLVEYLNERNPTAARKLAERIFTVIDSLAGGDFEGPVSELTTGERVRSWAVPPVRVYYQRHDAALWILRIYDLRQQPIER